MQRGSLRAGARVAASSVNGAGVGLNRCHKYADNPVTMNRAQRWLVGWAAMMVVVQVADSYLLPAQPMPAASSLQWWAGGCLALFVAAWWGGARDLRRRPFSPERRTLALRCWHATGILVAVPLLVTAVIGRNPLWWMAVLGGMGFVATFFLHAGTLSASELEDRDLRGRPLVRAVVIFFVLLTVVVLWLSYDARRRSRLAPHGAARPTVSEGNDSTAAPRRP